MDEYHLSALLHFRVGLCTRLPHQLLDADSALLHRNLTPYNLVVVLERSHILAHVAHLLELAEVLLVGIEQLFRLYGQVVLRNLLLGEDYAVEGSLPALAYRGYFLFQAVRHERGVHQHTALPFVVDGQQQVVVHLG